MHYLFSLSRWPRRQSHTRRPTWVKPKKNTPWKRWPWEASHWRPQGSPRTRPRTPGKKFAKYEVAEQTTIDASVDQCFAVLLDFDRYPEWARDLKEATVLDRDPQGRAVEVRFRAAGMGYSTSYTLRYDYTDPNRLSWKLIKGDLARKLVFALRGSQPGVGGSSSP